MSSRIIAVVVTPGDLASAPPWVHRIIQQWTEGNPWEMNVYHEITEGKVIQHFDLVSKGGGIWATGEHHALMRHIGKDSVNVVARGAALGKENGLFVPESFLQLKEMNPTAGLVDEYAWLMGVSEQVVRQLLDSEDVAADIKRLVPDAQSLWQGYYDQAIRAVNLQ